MVENTKQGIGKKIEIEKKSAKIVKKEFKNEKKGQIVIANPGKKAETSKKIHRR